MFGNGTGNQGVIHPLIRVEYGDRSYGLMLNFTDKLVYCIDFSDRKRDFVIRA